MSNQYFNPYAAPTQTGQDWQPETIPPEDRTAAAFAHGASLIAGLLSVGWLSFVGPLAMWVLYKDRSPYVRQAAAGAFNFNIWVNVLMIIGHLLFWTVLFAPVGVLIWVVCGFLMIFTHLRGTIRSLGGRPYVYRHQLRILN